MNFKSKRVIGALISALLLGFGLGNPASSPAISEAGTELICRAVECAE